MNFNHLSEVLEAFNSITLIVSENVSGSISPEVALEEIKNVLMKIKVNN